MPLTGRRAWGGRRKRRRDKEISEKNMNCSSSSADVAGRLGGAVMTMEGVHMKKAIFPAD